MKDEFERKATDLFKQNEALFEDRRNRTVAAAILDGRNQVIAQGEARLGTESDPANIYYPMPPAVLPEEIVTAAKRIEVADDKKTRVQVGWMRLCENGTEVHYHFSISENPSA